MFNQKLVEFAESVLENEYILRYESINNSGSNRQYYRIFTETKSYILTENDFIAENQSFVYFANLFKSQQIYVPNLIGVNQDYSAYLQEDIGDSSLLEVLIKDGFNDLTLQLYQQSLSELAHLQISTKGQIDYKNCFDFNIFDEKVVMNDLFYFKDFFVERLKIPYCKKQLITEFFQIAGTIKTFDNRYFLYRDFQARNIFIRNIQPYFIDFQGGMQGFIGYDLVSLIWQAKANLPDDWKNQLKKHYAQKFIEKNLITKNQFDIQYNTSLILRFYQILGAYGLRGLVEKKQHFMESILLHLKNLDFLLNQNSLSPYPEMERLTKFMVSKQGQHHIKNLIKD